MAKIRILTGLTDIAKKIVELSNADEKCFVLAEMGLGVTEINLEYAVRALNERFEYPCGWNQEAAERLFTHGFLGERQGRVLHQ